MKTNHILFIFSILAVTLVSCNHSAKEYYLKGNTLQEKEDFQEAIKKYTKAIEINPKYEWAYFQRGISLSNLNNESEAVYNYTMAIELAPDFSVAYFMRGISKEQLQDYRGAINDFNKALDVIPSRKHYVTNYNSTMVYFRRGCVKNVLKDYRGAIKDFDVVLKTNPKDGEAYYHRGISKISLNLVDSAYVDLSRAGELGIEDAYNQIKTRCSDFPLR